MRVPAGRRARLWDAPLRVYVRDHAARAGATNRGEGLAVGRPVGTGRSARGRVIVRVLFTCSRSDSGRDRDVSARGGRGRYVMASWRAPRASYLSATHRPSSLALLQCRCTYVDFAPPWVRGTRPSRLLARQAASSARLCLNPRGVLRRRPTSPLFLTFCFPPMTWIGQ